MQCKPMLLAEFVKQFDDLMFVAKSIYRSDPCGAQIIRQAAWMLVNGKCLRCPMEYQRGYSAGYKAGCKEWMEGIQK